MHGHDQGEHDPGQGRTAGRLWAITSYYNPAGFRSRVRNYRVFRHRLATPLVTVELSCSGQFELQAGDADVLVQLSGGDALWQKERLLNVALERLPAHCDQVAWLDCDIVFRGNDWLAAASAALERHALIQPFTKLNELAAGAEPGGADNEIISTMTPIAADLAATRDLKQVLHRPVQPLTQRTVAWGFAWAARREVIAPCGLYDACIIGGGDRAMVCAAVGAFDQAIGPMRMNAAWARHYMQWAERFHDAVRGDIGFSAATVDHLWHGAFGDRRYRQRHEQLAEFDLDPARDLTHTSGGGGWRWNSDKPRLHEFVRRYFEDRREDGRAEPAVTCQAKT